MTAQMVSLKFVDFQQSVATSYKDFRRENEFSDVTLVCEEDQEIEAHKLILTACSPFFSKLLKKKHHNPMIYMRGVKVKVLVAIVDYIYHGEANILQEHLNDFFALAEELQLKGLVGSQKTTVKDQTTKTASEDTTRIIVKSEKYQNDTREESCNINSIKNHAIPQDDSCKMIVTTQSDMEIFKSKVDSMAEKIDDGELKWKCTVCGKATKLRGDIKRHIESHHLEGISHACSQCGKISRSSHALNMHILSYHRK